ncbi:MAG: hypothetical protein WC455_17855 [Dehalococcoidia bacterium]|jgi:hypothetical protein
MTEKQARQTARIIGGEAVNTRKDYWCVHIKTKTGTVLVDADNWCFDNDKGVFTPCDLISDFWED